MVAATSIEKTLLLFSTDDKLITPVAVRAFGDSLDHACGGGGGGGGAVHSTRKEWSTSKHVQHYRNHPAEYANAVDSFISSNR